VLTVIREAAASLILADSSVFGDMKAVRELMPELKKLKWIQTDKVSNQGNLSLREVQITPDQLALIQFTSGSTGTPKGVMISHENLVHNCSLLHRCGITSDDIGVSWTPVYHDMGLIFGMLTPIYCEFPMTVMTPLDFLLKPVRWLQEISDLKATITCAPNFAYDLCARKVTNEQLAGLDLRSLTVATVSAEPVRAESLQRFNEKFASCGFTPKAFHPAYGMAESTLVVVADGIRMKHPVTLTVDKSSLEQNKIVEIFGRPEKPGTELVSSGQEICEMRIEIVEPETGMILPDGMIGEVWVAGPSVAKGYWNMPDETNREFNAYLSEKKEGPFLKTGDLGFKKKNEIFITGRLKDMIIIHGRNYYPQDIERAVELADAPIRPGCAAAFSIDHDGEEKVVVIAEVERRHKFSNPGGIVKAVQLRVVSVLPGFDPNSPVDFEAEEAIKSIRKQVWEVNELTLHSVVLIAAGSIPKTSSGKIQRKAAREAFIRSDLKIVHVWSDDLKKQIAA
jgi:acyl-CoA synthetase (AMP-forming)/AMP-acid ligase II